MINWNASEVVMVWGAIPAYAWSVLIK